MSNPILDYIFVRKGGTRAKTPEEAFLATYLITATANKKIKANNQTDTKRGNLAIKEFYNKKSSDENTKKIRKILESFKKKLKSELKNDKDESLNKSTIEFKKLFEYCNNTGLEPKPSDYNTTYTQSLSVNKENVKNEFRRYNSKHPNIIDKKLMDKIGESSKTTIDNLNNKRLLEQICQRLFEKKNTSNKKFTVLPNHNGYDYIDNIYKLNDKIYRIIVGKKEAVATKGFSWVDKSILGDIKLEEKNNKYKLTKIAQGKTSEKYADTKADSDKTEFSFRYKIYLGELLQVDAIDNNVVFTKDINDNMKLAVLNHFGYNSTRQLGKSGYGAAYLDSKEEKNGIMRVIKVCIGTQDMVKAEWRGVNTAYKIFNKIKNPDSDTKKLREEFYKNENIVFNKNKAMGQISEIKGYTTAPKYKKYWYCISTSEFRTGGEASSVPEEDRNLFDSNKNSFVD